MSDQSGQPKLTHADAAGRVRMVDVSNKASTRRTAVARGFVRASAAAVALVTRGEVAKGDPLQTARIAGIMAAKRTPELVPLCHTVALSGVTVDVEVVEDGVTIEATVTTTGPTGVEMEALTAVSAAALTIYDMLKAVDRGMVIEDVRLIEKDGGRSGRWTRDS